MVLCECLSLEVVFRCRFCHDPVGPPPEFCCSHRRPVPSETRHQTWRQQSPAASPQLLCRQLQPTPEAGVLPTPEAGVLPSPEMPQPAVLPTPEAGVLPSPEMPQPAVRPSAPKKEKAAVPRPDHIVVVILENKHRSSVIRQAPYLNKLAAKGANMTHSY